MNIEQARALVTNKQPWEVLPTPKGKTRVWSIAYDCHLIHSERGGWLLVEYWGDVQDEIATW